MTAEGSARPVRDSVRPVRVGRAEPGAGVSPWVTRLARWMDTQFKVPGTQIRFGFDPILGLVPVVGDTVTALIGLYMIKEAKRLGAGTPVILKMVKNLAVDWVVGLVPGLDLILDTAVKAHTRNAELLQQHAQGRTHTTTT